ncbi:hypothetical protein MHU86_25698 [Fragilaria crotonensis]|nr:hypothetical protein MHU86_25698 [Fragilaria crotonensis]
MNSDALASPKPVVVGTTSTSTTPTMKTTSLSTGAQMGIFVVMLGVSAGLTLYTRKTNSMIDQMNNVRRFRRFPTKYGPMTKEEWNKIKSNWKDSDGFF